MTGLITVALFKEMILHAAAAILDIREFMVLTSFGVG